MKKGNYNILEIIFEAIERGLELLMKKTKSL